MVGIGLRFASRSLHHRVGCVAHRRRTRSSQQYKGRLKIRKADFQTAFLYPAAVLMFFRFSFAIPL
ncbi:hypothetical protein [Kingella potus]|uniref:hypothetical protein n=1 Tax=Kingella potus TaxID=265175 RepID=UPI001FD31891|nr:hypothetical protein [Kingella potus]UOP00052.1 hypothetical protein LVJ84_08595 [Kingella potus]